MTPTRPPLRYHGGKWQLAPWIVSHFPEHRAYVEPFGGGASVLLRKERSYAEVYNDLDGEVVNLFRILRSPAQAQRLAELVELTPFARDEFAGARVLRGSRLERARRLLIRSHQGFSTKAIHRSTGFRSNASRSGSHPAKDWSRLPGALADVAARLRGLIVENKDGSEVMLQHDAPSTLHYVDPPYLPETRGAYSYRHDLTAADHERLAEVLHGLRGCVILSGYPSPLYEDLYSGWDRTEREAHADQARPRVEVLWSNRPLRRQLMMGELLAPPEAS